MSRPPALTKEGNQQALRKALKTLALGEPRHLLFARLEIVNRIELLQSFIQQNPKDPFPRYGLALEYKKGGDLGKAHETFTELIGEFPEYVAAYLHTGNVLATLGKNDEAVRIYEKGIEVATNKSDSHARSELEDALATLQSHS